MLFAVVLIGLASIVALARVLDARRPQPDLSAQTERLYLTGPTVKRLSLGFNGLAADWYWMRALQYIGRKSMTSAENLQLDDLSNLNLTLLAPLLDTATTLDPQFLEPYEYAAVVLPAVDAQAALRITHKGIAANPAAWRLYHHLGYIYWQQKDFQKASAAYRDGAAIPGAPVWMKAMQGKMINEGGSRELAREIYARMYQQAEDVEVKEMARNRLMQLESQDQRDALRKILSAYQSRARRCPASWKEIEPLLRALRIPLGNASAPLDPQGAGYVLTGNCEVDLAPNSKILRK